MLHLPDVVKFQTVVLATAMLFFSNISNPAQEPEIKEDVTMEKSFEFNGKKFTNLKFKELNGYELWIQFSPDDANHDLAAICEIGQEPDFNEYSGERLAKRWNELTGDNIDGSDLAY